MEPTTILVIWIETRGMRAVTCTIGSIPIRRLALSADNGIPISYTVKTSRQGLESCCCTYETMGSFPIILHVTKALFSPTIRLTTVETTLIVRVPRRMTVLYRSA